MSFVVFDTDISCHLFEQSTYNEQQRISLLRFIGQNYGNAYSGAGWFVLKKVKHFRSAGGFNFL
jgi:hypothetical protein